MLKQRGDFFANAATSATVPDPATVHIVTVDARRACEVRWPLKLPKCAPRGTCYRVQKLCFKQHLKNRSETRLVAYPQGCVKLMGPLWTKNEKHAKMPHQKTVTERLSSTHPYWICVKLQDALAEAA